MDGSETAAERAEAAAGPAPPTIVIEPKQGLHALDVRALWEYRELVFFMVMRDLTTRYKQTALGVAWALLQPLLTMFIFTLVFSRVARISTGDTPYMLFAFAALTPWTYFAQAVARTGQGLIRDANLISKVYFPRLIIPLAAAVTPLADLALTFLPLIALMVWHQVAPGPELLALPLFIVMAVAAAMSFGLWFSALNVRYRDVQHVIPFFVQIGLFATPIAYPMHLVPEQWQSVYALNPMVAVVEGFRWCLLGLPPPSALVLGMGLVTIVALLTSGLLYFKATERRFADII